MHALVEVLCARLFEKRAVYVAGVVCPEERLLKSRRLWGGGMTRIEMKVTN